MSECGMERLFLGCFFSEAVCNDLMSYLMPLQQRRKRWSWVASEYYHFTIHFLGNQPEEEVFRAWDSSARAGKSIQPFTISLAAPEPFPSRRRFSCLAFLPAASPPLRALYRVTGEILDRNGIVRPEREKSFKPHLTVAKLPRGYRQLPEDLRLPPFGSLTLQSLSLVRSATEVGGTRYDERRRITFTNA